MKPFEAQTYYELLEVSVASTASDIRGAWERLNRLYADDQVALYGLIEPARAQALRARLQEAHEVLSDELRREEYDRQIGLPPREPVASPPPPPPAPKSSAPSPPAATSAVAYTYSNLPPPSPPRPTSFMYSVPAPAAPSLRARGEGQGEARPEPAPLPEEQVPVPPESPPAQQELALDVSAARFPAEVPAEAEALPPPVSEPEVRVEPPAQAEAVPAPEVEAPAPAPIETEAEEVALVPARSREYKVPEKPRPFEVPPGVEFNGDLLKQVRMARGVSLSQLSERTRIGVRHLENLEADRYDALPAAVYLRGILMNLSRELGLDGLAVAKGYLAFVDAHRSKG